MNKSQSFYPDTQEIKRHCIDFIYQLDEGYEVIIREISKDKTLKQLGGIYACWIKHIADQGYSQSDIHAKWKREFLENIYKREPMNHEQEIWVELDALYRHDGDSERYVINRNRISLSWANLNQNTEYMTLIEQHYITIGKPLPNLDPNWKRNKYEAKQ